MTLKLTDSQQWQVIRATNPLDMLQRDAFLAALLQQFAGRTEIGDGELFRTLRELQRQHFRPPSATHLPHKFPQAASVIDADRRLLGFTAELGWGSLDLELAPLRRLVWVRPSPFELAGTTEVAPQIAPAVCQG